MPQWQAAVLIVVSFGSLIVALYCLFFMVPVKRFWERIHSLGGGMKGIESHVDGVRDEVGGRLARLEEGMQHQISESREAAEGALDKFARDNRGLHRELEGLRKDLQSLQAELRDSSADIMKVARSTDSLTRRLEQLRSDFDTLDPELRSSMRQLVADSFSTVESTVLSALEAVQEEMLSGMSEPPGPVKPRAGPGTDPPRASAAAGGAALRPKKPSPARTVLNTSPDLAV